MVTTNRITKVGIFLLDEIYRINPATITDQHAPDSEHFAIFLDRNVSLQELGHNTLEALRKPRTIIPHPKNSAEWKASNTRWHEAMKFKSWKDVIRRGKYIRIDFSENGIQLSSSKPDSKGFGPSSKPDRFCPDNQPISLAQAILDTFADCEE